MSRRPGTTQTNKKTDSPILQAQAIVQALTETASGQGRDYLGSTIDTMTENEAIHILTSMVRDGSAGLSAPVFVKAILEIRASSGAAIGPPPPTTPEATYARLRRVFAFIDQPSLDRAYADHCSKRDEKPASAPDPDPDAPETPEIPEIPAEIPGSSPGDLE